MTEGDKSGEMSTSFQCCFNTVLHARENSSLKRGTSKFRFATQILVRECRRSVIFGRTEGSRWGTAVAQWLRCCATNRKVAGSIPAGVIGIFH